MSISPHENKPSNDPDDTGADKPAVSDLGKRIFFVTGEPGCGKSTFLAALIQKFNLQPSGFITKKEETEPALYIHQIINGTRFLPVFEQIPEATVFHLTPHNRPQLYAQLEQAQSFTPFLHAVSGGSPNGKK